jgi:hypothetical protein
MAPKKNIKTQKGGINCSDIPEKDLYFGVAWF